MSQAETEGSPSKEQWSRLYGAFAKFCDLAPWTWMVSDDAFAVRHPRTGQWGYCCIMGNLGEVLGLTMYVGKEGFNCYQKLMKGELSAGDRDILLHLQCLNAELEDRRAMDARDLEVGRELGLRFRGRKAWPWFRSFRPLHVPWHLTAEEADLLTIGLEQALEVCPRIKREPTLLQAPDGISILTRVSIESEGSLQWSDAWMKGPEMEEMPIELPPPDEFVLTRLKSTAVRSRDIWEVDFSCAPTSVQEHKDQRPFYPLLLWIVEHRSGLVLGMNMEPTASGERALRDYLLAVATQLGTFPGKIHVRKPRVLSAMKEIAGDLGSAVELRKQLPAIAAADAALLESMQGPI